MKRNIFFLTHQNIVSFLLEDNLFSVSKNKLGTSWPISNIIRLYIINYHCVEKSAFSPPIVPEGQLPVKSHRKDQHWTNMRLVGVEAGGAFSSVEVSQILVLRYISIFYDFSLQVHQAIILPLCENLSEAATDGGQEDLVILLPDTPAQAIRDFKKYVYSGGFEANTPSTQDFVDLLGILGFPLTSLKWVNLKRTIRKYMS